MKAVMYGAGNIGRGFIGALFSRAGYEVTFIDVVDEVVDRLNAEGRYTVRIVGNDGHEDIEVSPVRAVNGRDAEAAAKAIAEADIMATAVGVRALPFIAGVLAAGLEARGGRPLNIIICENLLDADKVLRGMVAEVMPVELAGRIDELAGFVEASIGRMVPVQTEEMQQGDRLRVCVERYGYLPVDAAAFVGGIPNIEGMVPHAPFGFYIRRKLFLHNMGHAVCAYLGRYLGYEYIYEAVADKDIRIICQSAMTESCAALTRMYGADSPALTNHMFDLLARFSNRALGDTCARVGGDIPRKLGADDRLIGAARACMEAGEFPSHIAAGCAAALDAYVKEQGVSDSDESALGCLTELSGLNAEDRFTGAVMELYRLMRAGASVGDILSECMRIKLNMSGDIV